MYDSLIRNVNHDMYGNHKKLHETLRVNVSTDLLRFINGCFQYYSLIKTITPNTSLPWSKIMIIVRRISTYRILITMMLLVSDGKTDLEVK